MQLLPRYLVNNRVNIVANLAGFVTEYKPVYQRQIQIYKGIDNILEFRLLNADQKPINTQLYIPKFVAFDENNIMILQYDGNILDDGSTATRGLFTITILENDLLNIKQQYIKYNISLVDVDQNRIITYTDTHFGINGIMRVSAEAFPGAKASIVITNFLETSVGSDEYISDAIDAENGINNNEGLHTAAIYTQGYTGDVVVQATLDNQVTESTNWSDVITVTLDGSETDPTPVNFNGMFTYIRFKTNTDPATLTKILVRN